MSSPTEILRRQTGPVILHTPPKPLVCGNGVVWVAVGDSGYAFCPICKISPPNGELEVVNA